ncbi:hypothetical protein [uncultured Friedmanniella sp.]|uniref:hypothetical protein n=1 Tax=uncultured Friedmanniella sp. TaxID=335381 RepID=UPI0035CA347D
MTGHEVGAWSSLVCLLLALVLYQFAFARRALATLGERILLALTAEPEADPDVLDLYHALRRQRLLQHVARLRRILADDSHQSAVRQTGNRLAYGQLLAELAELGEAARYPPTASDVEPAWTPEVAVAGRGSGAGQYAPRVEILDFGRPRRS